VPSTEGTTWELLNAGFPVKYEFLKSRKVVIIFPNDAAAGLSSTYSCEWQEKDQVPIENCSQWQGTIKGRVSGIKMMGIEQISEGGASKWQVE